MFRSVSKLKAWDIYAKELGDLGFGHPLWIPEPSPESGEVQLGDVGYLSQGKFCFLFNCMREVDDPVNCKGVPENFQVFVPPDGPVEETAMIVRNCVMNHMLLSGNAHSVDLVAGTSISADAIAHVAGTMSYKVARRTGACLALKRPAHQTSLHCTKAIFQYMQAHQSSWYQYVVRRRGRNIKGGQILFVTGFVKTAAWAVGAFRHESSSATLKIDAGAMFSGSPSVSAGAAFSVTDCSEPMSRHRSGPTERLPWADGALHPDDQCIFLQYAHVSYRLLRPTVVKRLSSVRCSGRSSESASCDDFKNDEQEEDGDGADEEVLDYIFRVKPYACAYACATSQDLHALRQIRRAMRPGMGSNSEDSEEELEVVPGLSATELNDIQTIRIRGHAFCLPQYSVAGDGDPNQRRSNDAEEAQARTQATLHNAGMTHRN